jgi:hypothetical protein
LVDPFRRRIRRAALAGVLGPVGFLAISLGVAAFRADVIRAQGWKSWPSDMALGGAAGLPQIAAFLLLAGSYPVFSLGALRPVLRAPLAWVGFLAIACGDLLLAFKTDGPGEPTSWHGILHLAGVGIVTIATVAAAAGATVATWSDPSWRSWRLLGAPVVFTGVAIGALAGFHQGWAKVVYVVAITAPVPLLAVLVRRSAREWTEP